MQGTEIITTEELELQVVNTLRYFHMFRHPLYFEDIYNFLGAETKTDQLQKLLTNILFCLHQQHLQMLGQSLLQLEIAM